MEPLRFIHSLQIADTFFPVGAFAYSDGLETAANEGSIRDAASLSEWMAHFVEAVFVPCEGLALVKTMIALDGGDVSALSRVDEELTAIRPSAAVRAASAGVGRRLLSLYASLYGDARFHEQARALVHGNAAVAYAAVLFHRGVTARDGALVFGYNRLAGIVSAALRLIAVGHQQGQELLAAHIETLPGAAARILENRNEPLRSFAPMLDIHQMNHQYVYSRLFRS
jgi:urease accessory protein